MFLKSWDADGQRYVVRERLGKGIGLLRINCGEGKDRCLDGHENEWKSETCRCVEFEGGAY